MTHSRTDLDETGDPFTHYVLFSKVHKSAPGSKKEKKTSETVNFINEEEEKLNEVGQNVLVYERNDISAGLRVLI